jgi:hypothetical protein
MQKLSFTSMVKLFESCRFSHKETNKIVFAFLPFSMNFDEFSKTRQNPNTIEDLVSKQVPEGFVNHTYTLGLQKRPWKEIEPCNVALGVTSAVGGRISASSPPFLAGEAAGKEHMLTRMRLVARGGAETSQEILRGGA